MLAVYRHLLHDSEDVEELIGDLGRCQIGTAVLFGESTKLCDLCIGENQLMRLGSAGME